MAKQTMSKEQEEILIKALEHAKDIQCKCGGLVFQEGRKVKILSKLITGQAQDEPFSLPAIFCVKCGEEFKDEVESDSKIIQ